MSDNNNCCLPRIRKFDKTLVSIFVFKELLVRIINAKNGMRDNPTLQSWFTIETNSPLRTFLAAALLAGSIAFSSGAEASFIESQSGPLPGIEGSAFNPDDINIDFRQADPSWGAGDNLHSFTHAQSSVLDVTVTAFRPTWSRPDGSYGRLFWADDDGYGVRKGEDDEIDRHENLIVEFSTNWLLLGIFFSDLFDGRHDGPEPGSDPEEPEIAIADLFLGNTSMGTFVFWSENDLLNNENNGGHYGATGNDGILVDKIIFRSTGYNNDEFSVAGLRGAVAVIPLPAAMPLFLTALVGLGGLTHRRRKQASAAA